METHNEKGLYIFVLFYGYLGKGTQKRGNDAKYIQPFFTLSSPPPSICLAFQDVSVDIGLNN